MVAEAIASGMTTAETISAHAELNREQVRNVMLQPIAMAWISEQCERLFKTRRGIIDAAVYQRAAAGDTTAAKLYYERMDVLRREPGMSVNIGQINFEAMSNDDLATILAGKLLGQEGRVIDVDLHSVAGGDSGRGGMHSSPQQHQANTTAASDNSKELEDTVAGPEDIRRKSE